jgi:hypothetical protein
MLLVAWILTWFGFDDLFIKGFHELFNKEISVATYYMIFLGIGLVIDFLMIFKNK